MLLPWLSRFGGTTGVPDAETYYIASESGSNGNAFRFDVGDTHTVLRSSEKTPQVSYRIEQGKR